MYMELSRHIRTRLEGGPRTRAELQRGTSASQATLSRVLRNLPEVRRFGAGRATRYALVRPFRDLDVESPIYRVTRQGDVEEVGTITTAHGGYIVDAESGTTWHEGLPWFLTDMVPQGFLGRRFPRNFPELELPDRLSDWSDEHALYAIARRGEDLPGNLIVGEASMQRRHRRGGQADVWTMAGDEPIEAYRTMAERVLAGEIPGSSAAGERPKFTACAGEGETATHYLVKFSPPINESHGRRWSDLLVCEHLAAETLRAAGFPTTRTRVHQDSDRTFLEVERFDRVGRYGRIGVVTLGALDYEFVGEGGPWPVTAAELTRGLIQETDYERIVRLYAFGQWIANNDMHTGNLAFLHEGEFPLALAPIYDMLPMRYAPRSDEVVEIAAEAPVPNRFTLPVWHEARQLAADYWNAVAEDARVSRAFRAIAREHLQLIADAD